MRKLSGYLSGMPLVAKVSDVESLQKIAEGAHADVPPFNVSRLIALALIEKDRDGAMRITDKGLMFLPPAMRTKVPK